jgi:hypothetical protein
VNLVLLNPHCQSFACDEGPLAASTDPPGYSSVFDLDDTPKMFWDETFLHDSSVRSTSSTTGTETSGHHITRDKNSLADSGSAWAMVSADGSTVTEDNSSDISSSNRTSKKRQYAHIAPATPKPELNPPIRSSLNETGKPKRRRYSEQERKETSLTRKGGGCVRCRMQGNRVSNPDGIFTKPRAVQLLTIASAFLIQQTQPDPASRVRRR